MSPKSASSVSWGMHRAGRFVRRHPRFMRRLGNMETRHKAEDLENVSIDRPVYVTGLARAGSTVMLELLASHPHAATHRYRDFPFVHTPLWWNGFVDRAASGEQAAAERFHADRIRITRESPEAMEEVLWMSFFTDIHDPNRSQVLDRNTDRPEFAAFYQDHLRKILHLRGGSRYVAKGNYNVTRMAYLHTLFPEARFVVCVRDPVWHVASLIKQHRLFCEKEADDPRVLAYMQTLGHFEFGADLRLIVTGDPKPVADMAAAIEQGDEVTGFSRYWARLYDFVAAQLAADPALAENVVVVDYDRLCGRSEEVLADVYHRTGLTVDRSVIAAQAGTLTPPDYYSPPFDAAQRAVIERETADTYAKMLALCRV